MTEAGDDTSAETSEQPDSSVTPETSVEDSTVVDSAMTDTSVPIDTAVIDTGVVVVETSVDMGTETAPVDCDPAEIAPTDAVYASASAMAGGDGSLGTPFKTITEALSAAKMKGRGRVIVDVGTYGEMVKFVDTDPGIHIEGGWKREGASWKRNCALNARDLTIIQSPNAVAVMADGVVHLSGIRRMTVRTKVGGSTLVSGSGESLIGVRIIGANSRFAIEDAVIEPGLGGAGVPGTAGTTGGTVACDGITDCKDGSAGSSGSAGPNSSGGSFTATGFVAGDGVPGGAGGAGANGTPGETKTIECITGCGTGCFPTPGCPRTTSPSVESKGKCGCGGRGGGSGGGGGGGGASIAIYVHGAGAKVQVSKSTVKATNGGSGAIGAAGGTGGSGTAGTTGGSTSCPQSCSAFTGGSCSGSDYYCVPSGTATPPGAAAGGTGGKGGDGGKGGGGAGGPSHALVLVAGADVTLDAATTLKIGTGGSGASGAPNGAATLKQVVP